MSALAVEPEVGRMHGWEDAVRVWEETRGPEGSKVEIIEGIITVAPPPSNAHHVTAELVQRMLYRTLPDGLAVFQTQGVTMPGHGGLYIPDLLVIPRAAVQGRPGNHVPVDEAELVVEITSRGNADHDRVDKLHGYASAGVPLYLLLDTHHSGRPTATLYGEPREGRYTVLDTVKYGEVLRLPEPFDLDLETGVLPRA
jgi:Uma2 family endonuclease